MFSKPASQPFSLLFKQSAKQPAIQWPIKQACQSKYYVDIQPVNKPANQSYIQPVCQLASQKINRSTRHPVSKQFCLASKVTSQQVSLKCTLSLHWPPNTTKQSTICQVTTPAGKPASRLVSQWVQLQTKSTIQPTHQIANQSTSHLVFKSVI